MHTYTAKLSKLSALLLLTPYFCTAAHAADADSMKKHSKKHTAVKHEQAQKVEDLKCEVPVVAEAPKPKDKKFHLLGLTLTPGGYFAGEGVYRSRAVQSEMSTPYNSVPLGNSAQHYLHETRITGRQSRFSLLVEGEVNPCTLLSGYVEVDFRGNGSANSNESNSFDLRQRNVYVTLDRKDTGSHFLAGQSWSLATTNFKGITPRNEFSPATIDAQPPVGFVWKRQGQFRFTQEFGKSFWGAISLENPQTTFGGSISSGSSITFTPAGGHATTAVYSANGSSDLPSASAFSFNKVPDVIGKVAYETKFNDKDVIHLEAFGLYRQFYDRVQFAGNVGNTDKTNSGGGLGFGAVARVFNGMLDLQGNILKGRGIGSYGSGQLPDVTIGSDGSLVGIHETAFMVGATLHATECTDLYLFAGKEQEDRKYFATTGGNFAGFGVPNADNTGCSNEGSSTCQGNTKYLKEITVGVWNKFYKGAYGDLRGGLEYTYVKKEIFSGHDGNATYTGYHTNDNVALVSLRYYPFT